MLYCRVIHITIVLHVLISGSCTAWFLYYPSQSLSYYNRSCGMFKYEIYKQLASGDAIDMLLWQNTMLV